MSKKVDNDYLILVVGVVTIVLITLGISAVVSMAKDKPEYQCIDGVLFEQVSSKVYRNTGEKCREVE